MKVSGRARKGGGMAAEQTVGGVEEQGEKTRERLLKAAVEIFGRQGYDGASTRAIVDAAGANIQAIPYYFGGKEGLYLATATYLGGEIGRYTAESRNRAVRRLTEAEAGGKPLKRKEAAAMLREITMDMIRLLLSPDMAAGSQFVLREQMTPTLAFDNLFDSIIGPLNLLYSRLVAVMLGQADPLCPAVRVRAFSFLGGLFVFRFGKPTLLKVLQLDDLGDEQMALVAETVDAMVASLAGEAGN